MRVALAACAEVADGDPDDAPLPALLGGAEWRVWDDEGVDWDVYDLVVLRSTWDYPLKRSSFLEWAARLGSRLVNPPAVVTWNTDKARYLRDLRADGIAVVPTVLVPPGGALPDLECEVVVKPAVSAGSRDTARFGPREEAYAKNLIGVIHRTGRTAMVQPYVGSVDARGETALLYFGGVFSHSVSKAALLEPGRGPTQELYAPETIEPRAATAAERALADRVVACAAAWTGGGPLAYARVDVVEGPGGMPLLLELDVTEPSLFLAHAPGAAERFAAAILPA